MMKAVKDMTNAELVDEFEFAIAKAGNSVSRSQEVLAVGNVLSLKRELLARFADLERALKSASI